MPREGSWPFWVGSDVLGPVSKDRILRATSSICFAVDIRVVVNFGGGAAMSCVGYTEKTHYALVSDLKCLAQNSFTRT